MWAHLPFFGPLTWLSLTFDLDRCDLWPWTVRPWPCGHMTSTLIKALENNVWHISPWPTRPLSLTYMTFDLRDLWSPGLMSKTLCKIHENHVLVWHGDLDLWPMTFNHDLDIVNFYDHAKFGGPNANRSWDMNSNFCLVTDGQTYRQTDRAIAQVGSKMKIFKQEMTYFYCSIVLTI